MKVIRMKIIIAIGTVVTYNDGLLRGSYRNERAKKTLVSDAG